MKSTYTSSLLAHFIRSRTKDGPVSLDNQFRILARIIDFGCLSSNASSDPNYRCTKGYAGMATNRSARSAVFTRGDLFAQQCVCFCDIPSEGLDIHVSKYGSFGLAFEKQYLVPMGATPAFYVATDSLGIRDMTRGEDFDERIADYFTLKDLMEANRNDLMRQASTRGIVERFEKISSFLEFTVLGLLKPFDTRLPDAAPENVYLEREWRVLGDISFDQENVAKVYAPPGQVKRVEERFPALVGRIVSP